MADRGIGQSWKRQSQNDPTAQRGGAGD